MDTQEQPFDLSLREAGRKGGLITLTRHGKDHLRKAGSKGQAALAAKVSSDQRRQWGRLGGRPRKPRFPGEEVDNDRREVGSPPDYPASSPPEL